MADEAKLVTNHVNGTVEALLDGKKVTRPFNALYLDGTLADDLKAEIDANKASCASLAQQYNDFGRICVVDDLTSPSTDKTKLYINKELTTSPDPNRTITWTDGGDQKYYYLSTINGDIRASNLKPGDMICFTRNTATANSGVTAKKRPSIYFVKSITAEGHLNLGTTDYTMVLCRKPAREFQLPYNSAGEQPGYYPVNSVGYAARGGPSDEYGYGIVLNRPFQQGTDTGRGIAQIYIPDSPGSASDHQVMVRSLWGITDSNYADQYKTVGWTKIATGTDLPQAYADLKEKYTTLNDKYTDLSEILDTLQKQYSTLSQQKSTSYFLKDSQNDANTKAFYSSSSDPISLSGRPNDTCFRDKGDKYPHFADIKVGDLVFRNGYPPRVVSRTSSGGSKTTITFVRFDS